MSTLFLHIHILFSAGGEIQKLRQMDTPCHVFYPTIVGPLPLLPHQNNNIQFFTNNVMHVACCLLRVSEDDCFELGRIAYNSGDYYHTILWMDQALGLMRDMTPPHPNLALAIDYLAYASYMVRSLTCLLEYILHLYFDVTSV